MIDVNRLRHAVAIAEHGTFGAAALSLHLSQSALTRSIQSLESEFGVRLFERGRAGAKLTTEGTRFIAQAEQLVRHAASVESDLRDISAGRDAAVNVGTGPISATLFLPGILESLLGLSERFPIRVKVGSNSELRYMLDAGELDFYVGGVPRESHGAGGDGLRMDSIRARSRLALLAREGHPLLESPEEVELRGRFPVVAGTFARDTSVGADVERHGFGAPAFVLDDYDLLADLVRRTDAVLLATELIETLRPELGLRRLDIDVAPHADANYGIVTSQAHRLSAAAREVAELVRQTITAAYTRS
ncbi:LysR family transcriptional regulator [Agromyces aerolatus]|uniref:LysR family transcriptional regulator n=1 Tax=Agromyces sp. LY-1074 TaxID=3074080 RepID=UPI002855B06B|nr:MULTISPECIES: LysR family transcriptional regulator [unclassified Agromyces]MDR5701612.1 LysR family transcriptional regulator [Agromyces sp. LY-1074]MDR5706142.1 LysR family transcriptional regulator [Agromyces sp. LY-1358]